MTSDVMGSTPFAANKITYFLYYYIFSLYYGIRSGVTCANEVGAGTARTNFTNSGPGSSFYSWALGYTILQATVIYKACEDIIGDTNIL